MPDDLGGAPPRNDSTVVLEEILDGLLAERKALPPKLFYDAEGCRLFGAITALPEYYPTRTEHSLLGRHAADIASHAADGATLVEYGASDEGKALHLLRTGRFASYAPIDIANEALAAIVRRLAQTAPDLAVHPVCADFMRPLALPAFGNAAPLGFFPGSTIGNMDPAQAGDFLRSVHGALGSRSLFVVGTDLHKDERTLVAAYDDADGVTARFNRNILHHVNRLAGADFAPDRFAHLVLWNREASRIEMHLASLGVQDVSIGERSIRFRDGETIHTENSYKYTKEGFAALAASAGWTGAGYWTDDRALFGIHLLAAA